MDDSNRSKLVNQLLQKAPTGAGPNRMPIIPMPSTTVHTPAQVITSTNIVSRPNSSATAGRADVPRVPRRVQQQYINVGMPTPAGTSLNSMPSYGGAYNNHLYNRSYMNNMGMGNINNHFNSFGQPLITPKYQNPIINAAAESSRPAFDSIWSVVESFNAVSMMLETTLAAMQTSFQALLTVAENFTRLKMFMTKLYSTVVSFKLLRWFLTKLFYLLRMVRGGRGTSTEENVWAALSNTNQVTSYDGLSWPVVVFTGLLVATPYFVYKLLNSVTPLPVSSESPNQENRPTKAVIFKSTRDWNNHDPKTIPLEKGAAYVTSIARLSDCVQNGGWLLVDDINGKSGYVPFKMLKIKRPGIVNSQSQTVIPETSNMTFDVVPQITEQIPPSQSISPIIDVDNNPIDLPHPFSDYDKFKNDTE